MASCSPLPTHQGCPGSGRVHGLSTWLGTPRARALAQTLHQTAPQPMSSQKCAGAMWVRKSRQAASFVTAHAKCCDEASASGRQAGAHQHVAIPEATGRHAHMLCACTALGGQYGPSNRPHEARTAVECVAQLRYGARQGLPGGRLGLHGEEA